MPLACQTSRTNLENSLKARFDSTGPSGILLDQETALNANPDLGDFTSDPLTAVINEKARIDTFLLALAPIPITDKIPPALLTLNQTAATARQTFLTGTRTVEMDSFLNTDPGYYNTRFETTRLRVEGGGSVHQINFYIDQINNVIPTKIAALEAQREFLETLLP